MHRDCRRQGSLTTTHLSSAGIFLNRRCQLSLTHTDTKIIGTSRRRLEGCQLTPILAQVWIVLAAHGLRSNDTRVLDLQAKFGRSEQLRRSLSVRKTRPGQRHRTARCAVQMKSLSRPRKTCLGIACSSGPKGQSRFYHVHISIANSTSNSRFV